MVSPPKLNAGDTVGIVSTARKIAKEELKYLLDLLESWGLKFTLGASIGATNHQFAGEDQVRLQDFQQMLDNPNIKAVWCAKGGYGTVRIIDRLDFQSFVKQPKWIIGYSDVTVLHSHVHGLGVASLHANMASEIETKTEATRKSIKGALFGKPMDISTQASPSLNRDGIATGVLVGGNLSILYSLCGSDSTIHTEGKILFIEDLDEYLYHIDRMVVNLKRNGMLSNLKGLVVGGMSDMNDNSVPFGKTAEEIVLEHVREYNYPVCFGFPAGHVLDNRCLVLGRKVKLEVSGAKADLSYQ